MCKFILDFDEIDRNSFQNDTTGKQYKKFIFCICMKYMDLYDFFFNQTAALTTDRHNQLNRSSEFANKIKSKYKW